jgi:hypothetical protein
MLLTTVTPMPFGAEPGCAMFSFDATRDRSHVEIRDFGYCNSGMGTIGSYAL